MKKLVASVAVFALAIAAVAYTGQVAKAANTATHSHSTAGMKAGTWTGEVLDSGCYLSKGAMGTGHAECALKCASQGMPMLLLTKDGKAILLTPNHDNPDPYEALKGMAGSMATVTGTYSERGGVKGIDVTGATAAK